MFMAKVVGNVVATRKEESLVGSKFMVVRRVDTKDQMHDLEEIAADYVGAGIGDYVMAARGSAARVKPDKVNMPIDLAIIGIIDSVDA